MGRILFVDDDPLVGMMTTMALGRLGHAVDAFTGVEAALEAFGRTPGAYALVISDVHLGRECGFELCRRAVALRPGVPVIMVSGLVEPADEARAREAGAIDLLAKSEVLTRFDTALARYLPA